MSETLGHRAVSRVNKPCLKGGQEDVGSSSPSPHWYRPHHHHHHHAMVYGRTFRTALKSPARWSGACSFPGLASLMTGWKPDPVWSQRSALTSCHFLLVGGTMEVREGPCPTLNFTPLSETHPLRGMESWVLPVHRVQWRQVTEPILLQQHHHGHD